MCVISNPPTRTSHTLDPIKNQVKRISNMMIFWRGFSPIILYGWSVTLQAGGISSNCGKAANNLHFQKTVANILATYVFVLLMVTLTPFVVTSKFGIRRKIWRNSNKNTEVVLVRGVSKRRSFWGGDFNRGGSFQAWCYTWMSQKVSKGLVNGL